jgi:hypothetical protein
LQKRGKKEEAGRRRRRRWGMRSEGMQRTK